LKIASVESVFDVWIFFRESLQNKLTETKHRCDDLLEVETELRKSLREFQQRALDAEAQVLLITGQKDEEESQVNFKLLLIDLIKFKRCFVN